MSVPRRKFIKYLTFGSAASVVAGKLWRRDVLAYCENLGPQKTGTFQVRLSDYPALQQPFGSVRLSINPIVSDDPPSDGRLYPIILTQDGVGTFRALDSECRHARCIVPTYDLLEFQIRCPCHGSCYDIDGSVTQGPATQPLYNYPCSFDGNNTLTIQIPCWGFDVSAAVVPENSNRLRIDFAAMQAVTYEVKFRATPTAAWSNVNFSLTPAGAMDQTSIAPAVGPVSIYVARSAAAGFFAVATVLTEV